VTKPQGRHLRFGCPQCNARLRVRPSRAGTKQRCPQCGHQFVVPTAEQAAVLGRRAEEYTVYEGGDYEAHEGAAAADAVAVADCPTCNTRIYAPEDQIGHEVACPDCGTKVVLARRPEPRTAKGRPADEEAAYAIRDDVEQPAGSPSATDQVDIPVHCPVCDTLLYGSPDQVGKHILCPDCYTPVEVPPPKAPAVKQPTATHGIDAEYALQVDVDQPAPESLPQEEPPIPVVCSLCQTRMHAARDQAGEMITCPDCGTPMVVPRPETTPKPGGGEPVGRVESRDSVKARRVGIAPGDGGAADEADGGGIARVRRAGPRWPLVRGIVSFLWYEATWPRLIGLTFGLLVVLFPVLWSVSLMKTPVAGLANAAPLVGAMVLLGVGGLCCTMWAVVASAFLMTIIQDTAEGSDRVEDWPEAIFADWAGDILFFFSSVCVSILPGVAFVQISGYIGPLSGLIVPASALLLFPVVMLSMLEGSSPLSVLSFTVLRSLFSTSWVWILFYLETAVLVAAFVFFAAQVFRSLGPWGLYLPAALSVAVLMVYCRLLGRLAWCCGPEHRESAEELRDLAGATGPPADGPPRTPASPKKKRKAPRPAPKPAPTETPIPQPKPAPAQEPSPTQEQLPPQSRAPSILDDDFDLS